MDDVKLDESSFLTVQLQVQCCYSYNYYVCQLEFINYVHQDKTPVTQYCVSPQNHFAKRKNIHVVFVLLYNSMTSPQPAAIQIASYHMNHSYYSVYNKSRIQPLSLITESLLLINLSLFRLGVYHWQSSSNFRLKLYIYLTYAITTYCPVYNIYSHASILVFIKQLQACSHVHRYTFSNVVIFVFVHVHRSVNVMIITRVMTAVGVNLVIMETTVVNHKFSLDHQLLLTLMRIGRSSLRFFVCYLLMTLTMLSFQKNPILVTQTYQWQISPSTNCMYGYTIMPQGTLLLRQVSQIHIPKHLIIYFIAISQRNVAAI